MEVLAGYLELPAEEIERQRVIDQAKLVEQVWACNGPGGGWGGGRHRKGEDSGREVWVAVA